MTYIITISEADWKHGDMLEQTVAGKRPDKLKIATVDSKEDLERIALWLIQKYDP